jgi:hypothetical protein
MAGLRVWITPDKAWRVDVRADGRFTIVERSIPRAGGKGGLPAARAALEAMPDAPAWAELIED